MNVRVIPCEHCDGEGQQLCETCRQIPAVAFDKFDRAICGACIAEEVARAIRERHERLRNA